MKLIPNVRIELEDYNESTGCDLIKFFYEIYGNEKLIKSEYVLADSKEDALNQVHSIVFKLFK